MADTGAQRNNNCKLDTVTRKWFLAAVAIDYVAEVLQIVNQYSRCVYNAKCHCPILILYWHCIYLADANTNVMRIDCNANVTR